ncbi:hypothetical protein LARI1_G008551 [Lachnellula arida]|uniref:Uncharacterized protein n=1 Tax=Lachnellula arida TaxID=1316785 RepID=A0A8T9B389_9HELO|nr:hypothetical protein LARI1_G008551 [Lachnellula arida]
MASLFLRILHLGQAAFSAYNIYLSSISISNLQKYEETSKKAARYSKEAARQLHKTRTTQASSEIAVLTTLLTSAYLVFASGSKFWGAFLALANVAVLVLVRDHVGRFWKGAAKIPAPKMGEYSEAVSKTQEVRLNMAYLAASWVVAGVLAIRRTNPGVERHARPYIPTPVSMKSIKSSLLRCNGFIKRVSQSRELKRANSTVGNDRYEVCQLLADKGIPCTIWLEDLLALHGSNTQVWDLNLLVEDPRAAAKVLRHSGYKETTPDAKFEDDPDISERTTRVAQLQSSTAVVLHYAKNWYFQLDDRIPGFLPPVHSFLDSMIEFWLNISSQDYVDRLGFALYIGCLICYCYDLQTSDDGPVKNPAYAEKLKPEHREVHYNITAADPKEESFTTTNRHTYHARRSREIKEGIFVPRPYEKGVFRAPLTTVSEQ